MGLRESHEGGGKKGYKKAGEFPREFEYSPLGSANIENIFQVIVQSSMKDACGDAEKSDADEKGTEFRSGVSKTFG